MAINPKNVYCEICGSCGIEGCCPVERFIRDHVKGKTNCLYEDTYIEEILKAVKYRREHDNG